LALYFDDVRFELVVPAMKCFLTSVVNYMSILGGEDICRYRQGQISAKICNHGKLVDFLRAST